jgi:hypothetical protein
MNVVCNSKNERKEERKGVRRTGRRQSGAPWGNLRTIFSAPSDNIEVEVAMWSLIVAEYKPNN